jgi:hypothetical protein
MNALTLDGLYESWERSRRNAGLSHGHIKAARQLVSSIRGPGWSWLAEALNDKHEVERPS